MDGHAPLGRCLEEFPFFRCVAGFIPEFVGDVEAIATKAFVIVVDVAASAQAKG